MDLDKLIWNCAQSECRRLPEVLDVILGAWQRQGVADRTHEGHCLLGGAPVHIWKQAGGNQVRGLVAAFLNARMSGQGSPGFLTVT